MFSINYHVSYILYLTTYKGKRNNFFAKLFVGLKKIFTFALS